MLLEKWCWLAGHRGTTNLQFVKKNTESVKRNKVESNRTRSVSIREHFLRGIFNNKRWEFDLWIWKIPEEGHGNTFQYFCLENPMDRGAWPAAVHGGMKSQTWLDRLSTQAQTRVIVPIYTTNRRIIECHLVNSTFLGEKIFIEYIKAIKHRDIRLRWF